MQYEIKHIDPFRAAKIVALITLILGLIVGVPSFALMELFGITIGLKFIAVDNAPSWLLLVMPFVNFVVAYVVTVAFCLVYNWGRKHIGGFTIRLDRNPK